MDAMTAGEDEDVVVVEVFVGGFVVDVGFDCQAGGGGNGGGWGRDGGLEGFGSWMDASRVNGKACRRGYYAVCSKAAYLDLLAFAMPC